MTERPQVELITLPSATAINHSSMMQSNYTNKINLFFFITAPVRYLLQHVKISALRQRWTYIFTTGVRTKILFWTLLSE